MSAHGTDSHTDDEYLLDVDGFLTPPTLAVGTIGAGPAEVLKREPSFFDDAGLTVHQHFAVSDDGTEIPYFVVAPKGVKLDRPKPPNAERKLQNGARDLSTLFVEFTPAPYPRPFAKGTPFPT